MEEVKISVIIPTYNAGTRLVTCLEHLLDQEQPPPYEVVVADDGSKDFPDIPRSMLDDSRLVILRLEHKGPAATRNRAIEKARGEYVLHLGDDIMVERNFIKAHHECLAGREMTASLGFTPLDPDLIDPEVKPLLGPLGLGGWSKDAKNSNPKLDFNHFATCNLALKRDLMLQEKLDESFPYAAFEDTDAGYRLEKRGLKIVFNPAAAALHAHRYTLDALLKRQWQLGYCLAYFHSKHPELRHLYVKHWGYHVAARVLGLRLLSFMGKYHLLARCFLEKARGVADCSRDMETGKLQGLACKRPPRLRISTIISRIRGMTEKKHSSYIFFVTSVCNMKCKFCFNRDNVNTTKDMSFEEIEALFARLGKLDAVLFSGGEPFLRKDLVKIVDLLVREHGVSSIAIPTNGYDTDTIIARCREMLAAHPMLYLVVSISLDAQKEMHDEIRGRQGAFDRAIATAHAVDRLEKDHERFSLNINTVIAPQNVKQIPDLIKLVKGLGFARYDHSFELMRPTTIKEPYPKFDDIRDLKSAYAAILKHKDEVFLESISHYAPILRPIYAAMHYANLLSLYRLQYDFFTKGKKWPTPCQAGDNKNVIYNNGDLSICELIKPFANLKDVPKDKDLKVLFEEHKDLAKNCYCTHLCYAFTSLYRSKWTLFVVMPANAVRYLMYRIGLASLF